MSSRMSFRLPAAVVFAFLLCSIERILCQPDSPIVDLGYARYQGLVNPNTGNTQFLGLRYAAPPTGELRWREPQAPQHANGLQLANQHANICHQAPIGSNLGNPLTEDANATDVTGWQPPVSGLGLVQTEDCLFLDVYTPGATLSRQGLPVVVWIHGGGYFAGSASEPSIGFGFDGIYDGNDLIAQSGGKVVVVSIQYRVGLFGFLSSSQIKANGVLNAGLLDQQFALKWIQSHINEFGGDPKKVTIWGESAGAGSVLQHLIANGGNTFPRLFRGAMLSSTELPAQYPFNHRIPEFYFTKALALTGCTYSPSPVTCLRAADVTTLQYANVQISSDALSGTAAFIPVVDGQFIRESPTRALQRGEANTDNVLIVRNSKEGLVLVNPSTLSTLEKLIFNLFPTLNTDEIARAASLYNTSGSLYDQAVEVNTDALFVCPTYSVSNGLNGHVYQAQFAVPPALHTDDLRYYFPSITTGPHPFPNTQFINAFAQSFMDFVLEQNPNRKHDQTNILPPWPKWMRSSPVEMVFGRSGDAPNIATATNSVATREKCQFWASISSSSFQ